MGYEFQMALVVAVYAISMLAFFSFACWCFIFLFMALNRDLIERYSKIKQVRKNKNRA